MKRASYRDAIAWVALMDSAGDDDALNEETAGGLITAALVADIFDVDSAKVGKDVVRVRRAENAARAKAKAAAAKKVTP
jgi:hypothetical protein